MLRILIWRRWFSLNFDLLSNSQQKLVDFGYEIEAEKKANVKKVMLKVGKLRLGKLGGVEGLENSIILSSFFTFSILYLIFTKK
jgi:hypothetical protein